MENIPQDIMEAMAQIPCAIMFARGACLQSNCAYNHEKNKFVCLEEKELERCKNISCKFRHLRDTNGSPLHPSQYGNRAGIKNRLAPPVPVAAIPVIAPGNSSGVIQQGSLSASQSKPIYPTTSGVGVSAPISQSYSSIQQGIFSTLPSAPTPVSNPLQTHAPIPLAVTRPKGTVNLPQPALQSTLQSVPIQRPPQAIPAGRYYANSGKLNPPVPRVEEPATPILGQAFSPQSSDGQSITRPLAILTAVTAPDPKATLDKEENEFLMHFKAPLRDPSTLPEVERRNLLEYSITALSHNKISIKLYAARLLTEPLSLAHIAEIVKKLICSDDSAEAGEEESDFFTPIAFITRCFPLMKLLSHLAWEINGGTRACLDYILNTTFPDVMRNTHFIVRSIGSFYRDSGRAETENTDWPETYSIMLRCFIRFARISTHAKSFVTAQIITYWMLPFVELARDIWYPDDPNKKIIFDDLASLIELYKIDKYFPAITYTPTQRSSLNNVRRLACENSKKLGHCAEYEAGSCYFRHDEIELLKKFSKKGDSKFEAMNQWMRSSKASDKLTPPELKRFWDEALRLFTTGNVDFVLEVISLPQGLIHVGRTMEPAFVEGKSISMEFMEPFIKIFSDKRLDSEKYSTAQGPATKIAEVCAKHPKIFKYMNEYLQDESLSGFKLEVAISMIGLAKFIVNLNPIQKIDRDAREPLKELCRIIAVFNDAGTQQMNDAHKVGDRLGFTIRQNLLDNEVEIADRDVPAPDAVDTFDEPLVFNDGDHDDLGSERVLEDMKKITATEEKKKSSTADPDYTFTDALEKGIVSLGELLDKSPEEFPIILDKMEKEGIITTFKSFFKREHEYIPDPEQKTTEPSIFRHFVQFFGKICIWQEGNTSPNDFSDKSTSVILFKKLWGPDEFILFLKMAIRNFYLMHKDRGVYGDRIRRLFRKAVEGILLTIRIAIYMHYLPPTDRPLRGLILRIFRIFTDPRDDLVYCDPKVYGKTQKSSGYESWKIVHAAIISMLPKLEMDHLFRMEHVGRSKSRLRPLFKHPMTFTCPDRKLSKCIVPEFCQFVHQGEDLSSPEGLSELGSDDENDSRASRHEKFLGVDSAMGGGSESFVSTSASGF
ncbi:hypothetical protein TWF694_006666 [Orbilia ellipsospora]|uniref:C3H1-type domain-containing protein n=1 Tax=Orbilia ellipsospora TaxID=2528407 RepID=A0AAV9XKX7_9PEZI